MAAQPADVVIVGDALNTLGFEAFKTVSGLGLNTRGFLWPCSGIWTASDGPITTVWSASLPATVTTEVCVDTDVGG